MCWMLFITRWFNCKAMNSSRSMVSAKNNKKISSVKWYKLLWKFKRSRTFFVGGLVHNKSDDKSIIYIIPTYTLYVLLFNYTMLTFCTKHSQNQWKIFYRWVEPNIKFSRRYVYVTYRKVLQKFSIVWSQSREHGLIAFELNQWCAQYRKYY